MQSLSQLQTLFLEYLRTHPFQKMPTSLYEPVDYIMALGGKRMRPALLLMACNLFDQNIEKALPAAFAIEVFHNFSLVHDDIMDAAPLRRGNPTVHIKYDTNSAILSGDVMLIYAYDYLLKCNSPHLIKILSIFNKTAIGVCEGQQYDMNFETANDVTIAEYLTMIELKTAVLLAGAMEIGALLGGASEEEAYHLAEFGRNIGIAFQLDDDILDTFGDPEKFGKKVGGDIAQNKKTFLVIKALEIADDTVEKELRTLLSTYPENEKQKIQDVKNLFEALSIRDLAEKQKAIFIEKAFQHLAAIKVPEERKEGLKSFAEILMQREV